MIKTKYIIGIDPDVKKSGIACFKDGKLIDLDNQTLIQFIAYCRGLSEEDNSNVTFVVEDGNLISSVYKNYEYDRGRKRSKGEYNKIVQSVGANKQRATDLIAIAEHYGIKVVRQKPRKGNWSDKKPMFQKWTGWTKQSNPETRSASFFGYFYANS